MAERRLNVKLTGDSVDAVKAIERLNGEWDSFQADVAQGVKVSIDTSSATFGKDQFGKLSTGAASAASVAGALGGQAGGEALRLTGDVLGLAEQVTNVKDALKAAGDVAASSTGIIGSLTGGINALLPGVSGATAGVIALGAAALPIAAVAGGVVLALKAVSDAFEQGKRDAEEYASQFAQGVDARVEALRLLGAGDINGLDALYKQSANNLGVLTDQAAIFNQQTADLKAEFNDPEGTRDKRTVANEINALQTELDNLAPGLAEANTRFYEIGQVYNDAAAQAQLTAEKERQRIEQAGTAFEPTITAIREVSTALATGLNTEQLTQRIEDTKAALDAEIQVREQLKAAGLETTEQYKQSAQQTTVLTARLNELESAETKAAAAANTEAAEQEKLTANLLSAAEATAQADAAIARFAERQEDLAASRALQDARAAEDAEINRVQREQDLQRQLEQQHAQHQQRLEQIEAAGNERIAQLRQTLADKEAETLQRIADIQASFAAEQARKEFEFQRDQLRAQQEYDEQRLQIQRNTNDSLFDALLANDVTAALRAKREGDQALDDLDSNFSQEQQRARDDFEYQRQLDEQAKNEQLANLQAELDAFRAATAEKIKAEQDAIEARKAAEIAAYEEQLKRDAELRAIQQEREEQAAELRRQRLEEDRRIQDAAAQEALDKELANIAAKSEAEQAVYDAAIAKIEQLGLAVAAIGVPPGSVPGNATGVANEDLYGGGGYPVKDLGSGTVVPDSASGSALPDFAVPSGGGSGSPVTLQLTLGQINLGENVSQRELQEVALTIATETKKAVETVMYQNVRAMVETA